MKNKTSLELEIELILETLPKLTLEDLRSALYLLQLLEPTLDKEELIKAIKHKLTSCANLKQFITMWKLLLERAHDRAQNCTHHVS